MQDPTQVPGQSDDSAYSDGMLRDGFPGQRLQVLPRTATAELLATAPTSILLTTDAGYFPHAVDHGRIRRQGSPTAIVIVCTQGRGECESNGTTWSIGPGQALVIPPGCPHFYRAVPDDPWTIWWVHLDGANLPQWLEALGATTTPVTIDIPNITQPVNLIAGIVVTMESDTTVPGLTECAALAWQLLAHLALNQRDIRADSSEPVRQAQDYLRAHLTEPFRAQDLADAVGLSSSHLTAVFRQSTGTSPLQYLTLNRMARARELLTLTDLTVHEIATAVGYSDAYYFSRVFRRIHATTASDYRASSRSRHRLPEDDRVVEGGR